MALTTDNEAYLKLDTDNSTQPDATGNGRTGAVSNATYTSSGKINGAYSFDGSGDDILWGSNTDFGYNKGSISLWVNTSETGVTVQYIIQRRNGSTGDRTFHIILLSDNQLVFQLRNTSDTIVGDVRSTFNLSTSTWYHVVATWDGSDVYLYINNNEEDTDSQTGTPSATNLDTYIGSRGGLDLYFEGTLDEISIWSRALTSTEVSTLYNSGNGLQYPYTEEEEEDAIFFGGGL